MTNACTTQNPTGEEAAAVRYTYLDCLKGKTPAPQIDFEKIIFQLLMVGGMVTFMATFNGLLHSGASFFATAHWMYPLVFCIAFCVRTLIANKLVGVVAGRWILPRTQGFARGVAMTLLNVGVMGTIMSAAITLLLNGADDYLHAFITTTPITLLMALLVNFFVVGPAVKMLYNNYIEPVYGPRIMTIAQRYAMPWMAIFSN